MGYIVCANGIINPLKENTFHVLLFGRKYFPFQNILHLLVENTISHLLLSKWSVFVFVQIILSPFILSLSMLYVIILRLFVIKTSRIILVNRPASGAMVQQDWINCEMLFPVSL